jgi:hypothetical protein
MDALGGEFVILTHKRQRPLTAVGGGGRTTDVINTNGHPPWEIQPGDDPVAWQKFKFWTDSATAQYYAFQTVDGHFITANQGGGRITNTISSNATEVRGWEMFRLLPQPIWGRWAIQTLKGYFLTALGGGGHTNAETDGDTIHTDALQVLDWELFNIFRSGDFGTGSTYFIQDASHPSGGSGYLTAMAGGGLPPNPSQPPLTSYGGIPYWMSFTLLKQADGTYALQTGSGGILTALVGGLPGAGFRTDTPTIGNWEKFTLVDHGDFTAYIKTHAGTYLRSGFGGNKDPVTTVTNISDASRFRFWVISPP